MFISFLKTELVNLHFSSEKHFPPILKHLSTGPTINEHNTKVNYYYYYLNIVNNTVEPL